MRYLIVGVIALALLTGIGGGVYVKWFQGEPPLEVPVLVDPGAALSTSKEFDQLAREDPVKMLAEALYRYQREVHGGTHFTMEKQERVQGRPMPPDVPDVELIDAWVRGDVPDPDTKKTAIEVVMKWKQGKKRVFGADVDGTLFSEKPKPDGLNGRAITWRPKALLGKESSPVEPNIELCKQQSRYCIRDAGLYRSMLRTHEAWKAIQQAGEFKIEYLGKKPVAKAGGRECHIIKRICPRTEIDSFELGGTASTDPEVIAADGFTEVTIYIDAERWLQLGSELYRTDPDGTRVLVGAYFFRDVELNPTIPPDTFTAAGLRK